MSSGESTIYDFIEHVNLLKPQSNLRDLRICLTGVLRPSLTHLWEIDSSPLGKSTLYDTIEHM